MRPFASAIGAVFLLGAGVSASNASVVAMQDFTGTANGNVSSGGTFIGQTNNPTTAPSYAFDDIFTFYSTKTFNITFSILTSLSQPSGSAMAPINSPVYAFYSGTSNGVHNLILNFNANHLAPSAILGSYSASGLAAGSYYFELSGDTSPTVSNVSDQVSMGVSVSAVPLPASLPMFGAALLALGGIAFVRHRKSPPGACLRTTATA